MQNNNLFTKILSIKSTENSNQPTLNPPKLILDYAELLLQQQINLISQLIVLQHTPEEKLQIDRRISETVEQITAIYKKYAQQPK